MAKNEKKKNLPRIGAKRFGHRSHASGFGRMVRTLARGGYFDNWTKRYEYLITK